MLQAHFWTKFFQIKLWTEVKIQSMSMAISEYIFYIWMLGKVDRKRLKPYIYNSCSGNKISTIMYDIPKNSEKWVESEYGKI